MAAMGKHSVRMRSRMRGNFNKESLITTNSSRTKMPISCLGFGCKKSNTL